MGFFSTDTVDSGDVGVLAMDASRRLLVSIEADNAGIGGGVQHDEDDAHTTGDTGTMSLVVRNDTLAALAGTDGDYTPMQVDAQGALYVQPVDSAGNAITETTDNSMNVTIVADDVGIGGGTQHNEDAAHGSGDTGNFVLAVRNDDLAALAGTDGDYAPFQVDAEGALYTVEKSLIDSNNSSTSTLAGDATFTGTGTEVTHYASVVVSVEASHDSATDGLSLQFSSDNSNWDMQSDYSYDASDGGIAYAVPVEAQYFRVVYTNGSTEQTHFRLETILHANPVLPVDGRLSDEVSPEKRGVLTKSAIVAQASGSGNFVPIESTNGGSLKISLEEAEGLKGQATMANSVPVVVASDQSAVTVDLGANNDVTIDNSSIVHAEDSAHSSTDAGVMSLAVRNDTLAALAGTDGDYAPLQVDASGALYIQEGSALDVSGATVTTTPAVTGGGTEASAQRVTIANDSTGVVSVDDNGGSLTIDGTVTASNAAGDVAHDSADSGNPVKIGGRAQEPTTALDEVADDDRVDAAFDRQGRLAVWNGYDVKSADINDASSGDNTIVAAAGAGIRIAVIGYHLISDGTVDARWEDGAAGTAFTGQMPFQAREGVVAGYGFSPMWVGSANTLLNLELSAAVNVHGQVSYVEMTD